MRFFKGDKLSYFLTLMVVLSFSFLFVIIYFKQTTIIKANELYNATPEEIKEYYNTKHFKKPDIGPFLGFSGEQNYYFKIKENLEKNDYILINSVYEPRRFIYLEKHGEILKNNKNTPVMNRGVRSLKNSEELKALKNTYSGDFFVFSFFTYNTLSVGNLVFENNEKKQMKVIEDTEKNQMFIIFHEMMHSHTLQNVIEGIMLKNTSDHNKIYASQIKEGHSDITAILSVAKLYGLSLEEFEFIYSDFKKFRKANKRYNNIDLKTHDVRNALLLFDKVYKKHYEQILNLSFEAIPYFVFDVLKGVPYHSDVIHLNNRVSYCLNQKKCLPDELGNLIYGLYRYIPEKERLEKDMLPDFKTRYDMVKAFYKLAKKTLEQKAHEIKSDIGTGNERIFIKTNETSVPKMLYNYKNF